VKISCPACTAKYSIADDRVQDRLARIRCRKCGATIVVDGKASPPHVYTAQGEATDMADHGEAGTEYSVDFGEGDQRSMNARDIAKAYAAGSITGETYVWTEGFADWKPLSEVPELAEAVRPQPSRGSAPKPSPWDAQGASAPRAAARSARSPTADLFGGIDTAGSEEDVATSAPEQPGPSAASSTSSSGARNESSVLFSLSALTSQANQRPSTRPSSSASRDDSGLIDLKALTAAAMKSDATAAPTAAAAVPAVAPLSPLGAPPLGLASPLGGGITATTDIGAGYPQQRSKAPLFIGGGLAIGMIAIALALVLRPDPPPPPAPIVVAAPPAPAPAPNPAPAPAPTQEQEAKPPATGAGEEASPPPTKAPVSRATRKTTSSGTSSKKSSGDAAPAAAPASKPAPAKKTGGCGCAPGDLQCAMRCAAKGG